MKNKYKDWNQTHVEVVVRKNEETISILTGIFSLHYNNTLCTLSNNITKEHLTFIRCKVEEINSNRLRVKLIDGRELIVTKKEDN